MIIRVMQGTVCKVTSLFLNRKRVSSAICPFMALQRTPGNLRLQCIETCMNLGRRWMLTADGTKPGSLKETRDETNMQKSAYVGLRNQDSACYLNSVLQCLFFTREFREAIISCNNVGNSHIMYHLQKLCQRMTGNSSPNTDEIIQYLRMNNVHQLEVVECFQLLMNKIIKDKEEFRQPYQVNMVQSTTSHGGSYLMRLEKPDLNLTFCVHKCTPAPTVYSVCSCFETLPQILVIHLKRDPGDINVEVSESPSRTLKTEKQLDTVYELFVVCHHSGGIQGDQYMVEIKSVENDCWYRFTETQVQEIPEGQICLDEQHSATVSLLMYHRVNSDARPSTYVGLRNQGSTCYLNSLLQCLFFTRELREHILSFDNGGDSSIVCQLQKLFQELKCNESAPSTKGITKCLGVRDVHQQQDVTEYFRILMNKIVEDKKEIQQLYQVEMVHSIVCHGCKQQTRIKENPVLSLALSLDKCNCKAYSVSNALDAVQEENKFTGDEQFYCETCESKQDATSRCYFETLPPILVLNLKRYQFDGNWFRKLHYEVSVPFSLPVNLKEQTAENMDFPLSPQYELFAVCHHSGGIDGGHYVAEIKSYENECWYSFNDTVVKKMPEDMNTMGAKASSTAYLLMYRKVDSFAKPRMYVGLRNQSCSCYLNSLLHCLFFTRELREAILRCDNVGDSVIVCHLQQLFKKLMTGDSSPTTEKITRALEMGNVRQQLNVKECFQLLMNKIIEDKEDIQQLYQVKMVHRITCHGCHHQKMLKKSNLSICVSVQKQSSNCALYSVDHALADMQEEHPYTGDGQHYCQCCGNQRSTQCYCFETLPQILVIHLERDPVDINAGVSVPLSLTLTTGKQLYTDYELFGICHHIGAIHGDHYTAEVKSLEDNYWYHFNDKGVSEVSEEQISSKVQNSGTVSLLMYHKVNSDAKPEAKKIEKNTGRRNRGEQVPDSSMWGGFPQ
ncbi:unnamed protein product [Lepidochelys olivacea]